MVAPRVSGAQQTSVQASGEWTLADLQVDAHFRGSAESLLTRV